MSKSNTEISCNQCGRAQRSDEGLWMFCLDCGTFQCPSCYENALKTSHCHGCEDRVEGKAILDGLAKILEKTSCEA